MTCAGVTLILVTSPVFGRWVVRHFPALDLLTPQTRAPRVLAHGTRDVWIDFSRGQVTKSRVHCYREIALRTSSFDFRTGRRFSPS